jgi:hypothetical protein
MFILVGGLPRRPSGVRRGECRLLARRSCGSPWCVREPAQIEIRAPRHPKVGAAVAIDQQPRELKGEIGPGHFRRSRAAVVYNAPPAALNGEETDVAT